MLVKFGCFLLLVTVAVASLEAVDGDEPLERRVAQLELKLNAQTLLLESVASGLNDLKQQSSQILDHQRKHQQRIIESCDEATTTGRYRLQLSRNGSTASMAVVCDMDLLDGGWMVIQRRTDGFLSFNRSWAEYRDGFGTAGKSGEFWLGLEAIHQLTKGGEYELLVQFKQDYSDGFGRFQKFQVAGEDEGFELLAADDFKGSLGVHMMFSKSSKFSTYDRDNEDMPEQCAQTVGCGWWFKRCYTQILNGPYQKNSRMLIRRRFK